jgi:hypothetical protein
MHYAGAVCSDIWGWATIKPSLAASLSGVVSLSGFAVFFFLFVGQIILVSTA